MYYIEAPENLEITLGYKSIFLAGGITGCPDWQQEMGARLQNTDLILLNPRREDFPIGNPNAAREQIEWEYRHLHRANAILFWFCAETLNPIVLYELGAYSKRKDIFIGIHPEYERRQDVEIQMELRRPDVRLVYSLHELAAQVNVFDQVMKIRRE